MKTLKLFVIVSEEGKYKKYTSVWAQFDLPEKTKQNNNTQSPINHYNNVLFHNMSLIIVLDTRSLRISLADWEGKRKFGNTTDVSVQMRRKSEEEYIKKIWKNPWERKFARVN